MADKAKPGEVVKLAKGEGIFVDYESRFEVSNKEEKPLGDTVGKQTHLAIQSGGLLIVSGKGKTSAAKTTSTDESDLPEDLPGREAFVAAGMNFDAVKNFDFENDKVAGVGPATIKALEEYNAK